MTFPRLALFCALAVLFAVNTPSDAFAQKKKEKAAKDQPAPEPPVLQVPAGVATKPIEVQKIAIRIPSNKAVGSLQTGLFCIRLEDYKLRGGAGALNDPAYIDRLSGDLAAAGYTVTGNTNALFNNPDEGKADYLIGAVIIDIKMNVCYREGNLFVGRDLTGGDGELLVDWQIFSTRERRVIFQTQTRGRSKVASQQNGEDRVLIEAFGAATRALLAKQEFFDVMVDAPAAASAREPSSAQVAAAATYISRIPLSQRRFQDHAVETRGNVVTVFASGQGTGFFVSDRLLITNQHVVGAAKFVKVKLITGREILGEVLTANSERDVALIQTEVSGLPGLPILLDEPSVGAGVFAIGSPLAEKNEGTVSAGIISSYRTEKNLRYIQSDVNVMPGNSGGPLLDEMGNVIGLTVLGQIDPRTGGGTGLNFFIPITDAMAKLGLQFR